MFNNDTEERQNNVVKINNFEPHLVNIFLRFCYTGSIIYSVEIAPEMYQLADYYDVVDLRVSFYIKLFRDIIEFYFQKACLEKMYRNLKSDNVFEYYKFAYRFNLHTLKSIAVDFWYRNIDHFMIYDCYQFAVEFNIDRLKSIVANFIKAHLTYALLRYGKNSTKNCAFNCWNRILKTKISLLLKAHTWIVSLTF